MLNIFSGASLPFGISQVRIICSALSPILMGLFNFMLAVGFHIIAICVQ
jgi:hypothetical protein